MKSILYNTCILIGLMYYLTSCKTQSFVNEQNIIGYWALDTARYEFKNRYDTTFTKSLKGRLNWFIILHFSADHSTNEYHYFEDSLRNIQVSVETLSSWKLTQCTPFTKENNKNCALIACSKYDFMVVELTKKRMSCMAFFINNNKPFRIYLKRVSADYKVVAPYQKPIF